MPEDLEAFRREVREFIEANLTDEMRRRVLGGFELSREDLTWWLRILNRRGWAAPSWPTEHGGVAWNSSQIFIFEEECSRLGAPILSPIALGMVGPLIISAGTEEQKKTFLPPILDGSEYWCQGFSEPEAGSDLSSLKCEVRRDGDKYIVNGTKIWTSEAHWASWILLLGRSSSEGPQQDGITILMIDMKSPGLTTRPIPTLGGIHTFSQTFFDNVEVPVANRIGEEGAGWTILKNNIGHERISNGGPGYTKAFRRRLMELASRPDASGRRALDSRRFQERLAAIDVRIRALEAITLSVLPEPDLLRRPEASLIKVRGTELQQDIIRLMTQVCGYSSLAYDRQAMVDGWKDPQSEEDEVAAVTPFYLLMQKASISSGANEIQRDIIARQILR